MFVAFLLYIAIVSLIETKDEYYDGDPVKAGALASLAALSLLLVGGQVNKP